MIVLTDIDDTLTSHGKLLPEAYLSLWELKSSGIDVIPVTGRPAGWCDMIARVWPVAGVVGENGAFYFAYRNGKMIQSYHANPKNLTEYAIKLNKIKAEILAKVPDAGIASDQFCRMFDLAIDVCEDIPALTKEKVQLILEIFKKYGATAKLSSIHVNGWFGSYNKVDGSLRILKDIYGLSPAEASKKVYFIGDSPNDEPMWAFFENSFAVANIKAFQKELTHHPKQIMPSPGGAGFVEFKKYLLQQR